MLSFTTVVPNVIVTALSTQTVGHSLVLQCEVTTLRGITSRVDVVWSSDGTVVRWMDNVVLLMVENSLLHIDNYTISNLTTTDNGRVIQCEVVINTNLPVIVSDNITLNVIGEYC